MRKGDFIRCPHCGVETVVKTRTVMNGWTAAGEVFACTLCNGELGKVEPTAAAGASTPAPGAAKLAGLLGAEAEKRPDLGALPDDRRFCRSCRFFIVHPFQSRCGRHGRPADPMGDCADFIPKEES